MPRKSKAKKNLIAKASRMNSILRSRKLLVTDDNDTVPTETTTEDLTQKLSSVLQKSSGCTPNDVQSKDAIVTIPTRKLLSESSPLPSQKSPDIEGRRIVDISYFYSKLQDISKHGAMDCGLTCVKFVGERQLGLCSRFTLKCQMCNETFYIDNDAPGEINLNHCAVAGTIAIGCGHSQLQELSAALNLPIITQKNYKSSHSELSDHWEKVSVESMNVAAEKERISAIAEGRVDKNGTPIIDVIVDGCWSKRTYKKNYSALSGAAAIIGKRTGEVLFLGVRNKYCSVCAQAEKRQQQAKEHKCFKNYNGPSTAMESDILVEGFKCSIEMHNLIYGRMVSDGDSNTYSRLLKSRPYPHITIEKVECRNHLLRNLCNKLTALQTDTKFLLKFRKMVTQKKLMTLRKTVRKIIQAYTSESELERRSNIELLYNDILLSHLHAFGDHSRCKSIFCDVAGENLGACDSTLTEFYTSTLWSRICHLMSSLASHAPSLIHDIDSNTVERYNSVVAKLVGGKRINFSKRGSYQIRCHAAVVSFNTHRVLSSVFKSMTGRTPRGCIKKFEAQRLKHLINMRKTKRKKNKILFSKGEDINYGNQCEKPDMPTDMFEREKKTFLKSLFKSKEEKQKIERETILQSSCSEWLEIRRNILTASNFGKVIKRRDDISCHNLVKDILYKDSIAHVPSIKHGKDNEERALRQLEVQEGVKISSCGLYIDEKYDYLGATPDGIIDDDTIVEMKCPLTVYGKEIIEVVKSKKLPFYKLNHHGVLTINKTHNWFYQIQGQLHITKKNKCLFAIWCGENQDLKIELIMKDDDVWNRVMEPKLSKFYMECLLPELVDPRFPRNMTIRDPVYIQIAKSNKEKRQKLKRKHTECFDQNKEKICIEETEKQSTELNEVHNLIPIEGQNMMLDEICIQNANNQEERTLKRRFIVSLDKNLENEIEIGQDDGKVNMQDKNPREKNYEEYEDQSLQDWIEKNCNINHARKLEFSEF